tara:strand:+ start:993 stop:1370 length:378 start_codon:yes stop_codon:yes gene_type:complete
MVCSKCEAEKQRRIRREQNKKELEEFIRQIRQDEENSKRPSLWSKFKFALRGSIGMLKYATKISKRTSGDHIKHRQRVCESCPIYDFGICIKELGGCGCTLYYKIRVEKEKCPKDKWGPVEEKAD